MSEGAQAKEAQRQIALVTALLSQDPVGHRLSSWTQESGAALDAGLAAYRGNGHAHAERALAHACPTVQAMMGPADFAALARTLWLQCPPSKGDLAMWGHGMPDLIEASPSLAPWPFLADMARLDLACQGAERAADVPFDGDSLQALASTDPGELFPRWAAGAWALDSAYPVATLWAAHWLHPVASSKHAETDARILAQAESALAQGQGEFVWVWRQGWRARCLAVPPADQPWWRALMAGGSLGQALEVAGPDFDFETWLTQALAQGWLMGLDTTPHL